MSPFEISRGFRHRWILPVMISMALVLQLGVTAASSVVNDLHDLQHSAESTSWKRILFDLNGDGIDEAVTIDVSFDYMLRTTIFLIAVAFMGKIFEFLTLPALVGEIIAGFLLGPPLADFVPVAKAWVLIGHLALILMMVEFGIAVDVNNLKLTGLRCLVTALTGAFLALGVGWGLAMLIGMDASSGFALGASFAPTSTGIAANVLDAGNLLNTPVGQFVITAGVFDDVVGLILLGQLQAVANPNGQIWDFIIPVLSALAYVLILGSSAISWMPRVLDKYIFPFFSKQGQKSSIGSILVSLLAVVYMVAMYLSRASYLTGAFLAGLSFSKVPSVHANFVRHTKNVLPWMSRIFFAAGIGFQVPVKKFREPRVIGYGFLLYLAVLSKACLGWFLPKSRDNHQRRPDGYPFDPHVRDVLVTGFALACRGEMNFIVGAFGVQAAMFSPDAYAAMVWAVLLSTITCPLALKAVVAYYNRLESKFVEETVPSLLLPDGRVPLYLVIQARSPVEFGLTAKFQDRVDELGLKVVDHRSWHPRGKDVSVITEIYVQDTKVTVGGGGGGGELEKDDAGVLIDKRCEEVQLAIADMLQENCNVQVAQWIPGDNNNKNNNTNIATASTEDEEEEERSPTLELEVPNVASALMEEGVVPTPRSSVRVAHHRRVTCVCLPSISKKDLWSEDKKAIQAALSDLNVIESVDPQEASIYGAARHRHIVTDMSAMEEAMPTCEERLQGIVRHKEDGSKHRRRKSHHL